MDVCLDIQASDILIDNYSLQVNYINTHCLPQINNLMPLAKLDPFIAKYSFRDVISKAKQRRYKENSFECSFPEFVGMVTLTNSVINYYLLLQIYYLSMYSFISVWLQGTNAKTGFPAQRLPPSDDNDNDDEDDDDNWQQKLENEGRKEKKDENNNNNLDLESSLQFF